MYALVRPNSLRWLLCALNVALLALAVWYTLLAFNLRATLGVALGHPVADDRLSLGAWPDLNAYVVPVRNVSAHDEGASIRIAQRLEPPRYGPAAGTSVPPGPAAPSPLAGWTLVSVLETAGKAQVYAVIEKKAGQARPFPYTSEGRKALPRGAPAARWERSSVPQGRGAQLLLRIYDPEANPRPVWIGARAYYFAGFTERPTGIVCIEATVSDGAGGGPDPAAPKCTILPEPAEDPARAEHQPRA